MAPPALLTIAGHDPSGGAGLGTDLATWQAMGLHGTSVCTALTVQDQRGVREVVPTPLATLRGALDAARGSVQPAAVKLGMLGSEAVAQEIAAFCEAQTVPVVWDTVLAAAAGGRSLLQAGGATLQRLARAATVLTPNREEAASLLGVAPWPGAGAPPREWVQALRAQWLGPGRTRAVLLKGGHAEGSHSVDWLCTRDKLLALAVPRLPPAAAGRVHGTGCVYASVVAGMLAQGADLVQAAVEAQWRTHAAIEHAWVAGGARAMANPAAGLDSAGFPQLQDAGFEAPRGDFAPLLRDPGLYPVLPDADWVLRMLELGVDTLQLRVKSLPGAELRAQVRAAADAARARGAQLFINDHWREALDAGAYGVHLGQEDLAAAQPQTLREAGMRLGVSTHNPAEMARAHALRPSYIALGPVWPTGTKQLEHSPLGLARLRAWTTRCKPRYPVVAIGGIRADRLAAAMACGVDGVAVVGAVVGADDPALALRQGCELVDAALRLRRAAEQAQS